MRYCWFLIAAKRKLGLLLALSWFYFNHSKKLNCIGALTFYDSKRGIGKASFNDRKRNCGDVVSLRNFSVHRMHDGLIFSYSCKTVS